MNKKVIFITLYMALACFVGIGTYALIDNQVKNKQVETTQATTEAYVSEAGDQVGIIDSIDNHVASQKEEETTEYMADQISPDFVCYDKDDPNNPQHVVWYTPTTKATTEEATVAPPSTPAPEAPTTAQPPADNTTATPATTAAPATTQAPVEPAPVEPQPSEPAPETPAPETPSGE